MDLTKFFQASKPSKPLDISKSEDRSYYIDFAPVRGGKKIQRLERTISRLSPDRPTCQLFTGHIGCGKSTALLRLKADLKQKDFHVVYFQSTEELNITDIDVSDILLAIARQVSESLEKVKIQLQPKGFRKFLQETVKFLNSPVELKGEFSLPAGIGKIIATTRDNVGERGRLRQYLEPQSQSLLQLVNKEILESAITELKQQGKKGLVVIVDNLDRIDSQPKPFGKSQPEYLFIDRGDKLGGLHCHMVYTIPLSLIYSSQSETLRNRLGGGINPQILPMVPVQDRHGQEDKQGMELLRQLILARAFPALAPEKRLQKITELFDSLDTLDRLCRFSGGHVRNLLSLVYRCLQEEDPPWSRQLVEEIIKQDCNRLTLPLDDDKWKMLLQVAEKQQIEGDFEYDILLRNLFVFEYVDNQGSWFGINPALRETEKFKSWQQKLGIRD